MGSLCSDVNKLMDVAGQHGDHLREIFSAVPRFATKTELIAAIASVRQYKSNAAKASSTFSGEPQEDADGRMSKLESGLKALSQVVRSGARTNKEREDMVEEHQKTITALRQTNRKLEMRVKATEDEMKHLKEQIELLTSHGPLPGAVSPSNIPVSMNYSNDTFGGDVVEIDVKDDKDEGNSVVSDVNGAANEARVNEERNALKGSPSEDLENILSIPGPKSVAEIEREKEVEKERELALKSAVEKAARVEQMMAERNQLDADRAIREDEFRRNLSLEIQRLSELQSSRLATSSLSNEGIEALISSSVSSHLDKAMNSAKRDLTATLKEHANASIAASEKRADASLEQKLRRHLPDMDAFGDMVRENKREAEEVRHRLVAVEQVLALLDAEHSAIVSTFRQREIDRAASDHYCYSAIDTLTGVLDRCLLTQAQHAQRHLQGAREGRYAPVPPPPAEDRALRKPVTKVEFASASASASSASARPPRKARVV
jgi:hypothetical protein